MKNFLKYLIAALLLVAPLRAQTTYAGNLIVQNSLTASGVISPTQIVANQNNYSPTGLATAFVVRVNSDAARDITGLLAGSSGSLKLLVNTGIFTITLKNASGSSSAANQFALPGAADFSLTAGTVVLLTYDNTSTKWRLAGPGPVGTGTVTSVAQTVPAFLSIAGSPVTTTGTLAITVAAGTSGGVLSYTASTTLASSGLLTLNSIVLGGGAGAGPKTAAGFTTDGTSILTLGVAGSSVGTVAFKNATSGTVSLLPVTGALGTVTLSLPAATDTLVGKATTDTLTNKTLTSPVLTTPNLGVASGTSVAVTGLLTSSSASAGVGYATGAGLAQTQATNRTTGVTINSICGSITTSSASLASLASASFTVTNSSVAVGDVVHLSQRSGATNVNTICQVTTTGAGSFVITVYNANATTAETGAIILNFAVIKSVTS